MPRAHRGPETKQMKNACRLPCINPQEGDSEKTAEGVGATLNPAGGGYFLGELHVGICESTAEMLKGCQGSLSKRVLRVSSSLC